VKDFTVFMELIASIVALATIRRSTLILNYVRFIVILGFLNERLARIYIVAFHKTNNIVFYNVFILSEIVTWTWIYFLLHKDKKVRLFILVSALFYFSFSYYNLVYGMGWYVMPINPFRVFGIFAVLYAMIYFYRTTLKPFHDPMRDPLFWVCAGNFFYFSITFVIMALKDPRFYGISFSVPYQRFLHLFSNGFYYLLLSFSFALCYYTCSRPTRASSLTSSSSPA